MLDPRVLAERRDEVVASCRMRGVAIDVDDVIARHQAVARVQTELNEVNRRRKEHQSAGKKKLEPEAREAHVAEGRAIKKTVSRLEGELASARAELDAELAQLPNFVHPSVPDGGEDDGREIRRVGEPPHFGFEALDHLALGERLDLFDFEAGARVAGQKFYYLKNAAALLELGLQRYAVEVATRAGYRPYITPDLARPEVVAALGFNPRGEETQIYSVENAELCLVGTAEITLGGLYADTILEESELPIRMVGVSHCFRTEAGAAGRESKGLYRVHQFTKVEMFCITRPEDSDAMHEELLAVEEEIFQGLEIPYRVVDIAAGDLGAPAYRKFDLEAWMPGRGEGGAWGEITSTSNCTDYQARRLRVRFRREDKQKNELVHMLNGTAVSNARAILALLENHQQADGTVRIPKALVPYVGIEIIPRPS
ncbi:MAG: serine--tRNA ligase [Myxococcales bacterium]|nr:serine--tRNA ligase [Myxococcales bacterium]